MTRLTFLEDLTPGDGVALRTCGIGNGFLRFFIRLYGALNRGRRSNGLSFDHGVIVHRRRLGSFACGSGRRGRWLAQGLSPACLRQKKIEAQPVEKEVG